MDTSSPSPLSVLLRMSLCCRYLSALRSAAASAGKQLVGFERYLRLRSKGGNHTHINTLPISECAQASHGGVHRSHCTFP